MKLRAYLSTTTADDYYLHTENDVIYTAELPDEPEFPEILLRRMITFEVSEIRGKAQPALGVAPVAVIESWEDD